MVLHEEKREPPQQVDSWAHAVIGAALEVHRHLGPGLLESLYEEAFAAELTERGIPFRRQALIVVKYKGQPIGEARLDFLVGEALVVELKSVAELAPVHFAQVLTYLKVGPYPLGLLINFNVKFLKDGTRRIVSS